MLGRLLHLGSGGQPGGQPHGSAQSPSSRPVSSLESVHEDIHTRNLLFPDANALFQHRSDQLVPLSTAPATPSSSSPAAFDYTEDTGIEAKDLRVIIMQDALGPTNASLLFDSHPAPPALPSERTSPTLPQDTGRKGHISRKSSLTGPTSRPVIIQGDPPVSRQGAFDRRGSLHSRTHSQAETEHQRAAREYREELATFSSCIFGNSELMSYKGTSTKVHVVPSENRPTDFATPLINDGRSSIGRSSTRSSRLSQSFTTQAVSPTMRSPLMSSAPAPRYKKVLITRLFPVNLPTEESDPNVTPQSRFSDENTGFPFPPTGDDGAPRKKKHQPRQRRTPMYAIVLVVQLPVSRMPTGPGRTNLRDSSSFTETDMFPSSYSSTRPSAQSISGSGIYNDDSFSVLDLEDRIDLLTQHWDIIMRSMTNLQSVAATTIAKMLRQADISSPDPTLQGTISTLAGTSLNERRGADIRIKPPKSTTKLVALPPNCLSEISVIASHVENGRTRIVTGLSASRVITGQGRWGIWRDEAIWASRWTAMVGRDRFFYNLLTGFLATHLDWLQALCPPSYRRRYFVNRQARNEEDMSLPSRTIVVSDDKMSARRLIFLLSAFLPATQHLPAARHHRPSTSTSAGNFSSSPPTYVIPVLREESLRRKINRRAGTRRASHSRTASQNTRTAAIPAQLAHLSLDRTHERRASDAASIRTTSLAMPGNDTFSRKSSAATTTTIMPEPTMPHFSSVKRTDSRRRPRPGSSSSVAADDLKRSLQRGDSSGRPALGANDGPMQGSRWGNVISGLWSSRRRESSNLSAYSEGSDPKSPVAKTSFSRADKILDNARSYIVPENAVPEDESIDTQTIAATPREQRGYGRFSFNEVERPSDSTGPFASPVKASINMEDGVVDVDIPFPDYITSFESAISSPSSSGYLSTPGVPLGLDAFEHSARVTMDGDLPLSAAGWLRKYHPDFALQAIAPQDDLIESVKASLRAEPTPSPPANPGFDVGERWVDVSTVLIADTTKNTVTRILYRRLVKTRAAADRASAGTVSAGLYGSSLLTPSILPYETQLEEEWIEELVTNPDEGLVEAMNKVIDLQPDPDKISSSTSSQTPSDHTQSDGHNSSAAQTDNIHSTRVPLETPRAQCRAVILSTLEDTIRDVIDMREKRANSHIVSKQSVLRAAVSSWVADLDATE